MMNSFRIHLFFLVLVVCSCNQDAESKEEGSPNKKSGKTTNTSGYSVADVQVYFKEFNSIYLGNFENDFEGKFGKENLREVDDAYDFCCGFHFEMSGYPPGAFYEIDKKGVQRLFNNYPNIYGISEKGEITGLFKIDRASAFPNGMSGGMEVYADVIPLSTRNNSLSKTKVFIITDFSLENIDDDIRIEKLSTSKVSNILGRRVNSSRINHAFRYVTKSDTYILINLYDYYDGYSEIFLFQEEDGRYQPLNLERQTDYDASKFRPEKWESYMALGNCVMLPTLFQESPLILAELIYGAEEYKSVLFRLSDRGNSRRSNRVSSQTYEYESNGDRRMGKEIMRKSVDSQGRITWFYDGEKIGKHRLNREVKNGQEYVYFDSSPSKKYAIEYSRCGFTCRHPSGKTQFYSQVAPPCRN